MDVLICPDAASVGAAAARRVAAVLRAAGPAPVLGVATGSSPLALYEELAAMVAAGTLDLSRARAFALDEYVGLPAGHPQSYREVIARTVTQPLGMDPACVHVPDGASADLAGAARAFDAAIKQAGGVDVQILGVGSNAHIGFNEPGSSLASRTHVGALAPSTRADNQRFFPGEEVPTRCLTQGLGTIMEARAVVLVATGAGKATAVAALAEGPVTAMVPASVLQFHPHATVVVDEAAAAKLTLTDHYRAQAHLEGDQP